MPNIGFKDRATAQKIKDFVANAEKQRASAKTDRQHIFRQIRPVVFNSTVAMPAYACFYSSGVSMQEQSDSIQIPVHDATQPDENLIPYLVLLNGPLAIDANANGSAQQHEFQTALYNSTAPTEAGTPLGPVNGQWYLSAASLAITHRFVADLGDNQMLVRENKPSDFMRVKMIQTGGTQGDEDNPPAWVYTIQSLNGIVLEAGVQMNQGSRHDFWTAELGEVDPATMGMAYYNDNGHLIIHDCNEWARYEACG